MLKNTSLANISTPISLYNSKYSLNKKQDVCKVGVFLAIPGHLCVLRLVLTYFFSYIWL